jgi:hypothetical protein
MRMNPPSGIIFILAKDRVVWQDTAAGLEAAAAVRETRLGV